MDDLARTWEQESWMMGCMGKFLGWLDLTWLVCEIVGEASYLYKSVDTHELWLCCVDSIRHCTSNDFAVYPSTVYNRLPTYVSSSKRYNHDNPTVCWLLRGIIIVRCTTKKRTSMLTTKLRETRTHFFWAQQPVRWENGKRSCEFLPHISSNHTHNKYTTLPSCPLQHNHARNITPIFKNSHLWTLLSLSRKWYSIAYIDRRRE